MIRNKFLFPPDAFLFAATKFRLILYSDKYRESIFGVLRFTEKCFHFPFVSDKYSTS